MIRGGRRDASRPKRTVRTQAPPAVPDPRDPAIPVIDLSAGPGGLGEGFSRHPANNRPAFRITLSIERNAAARRASGRRDLA
jgi:hypothetical protein